MKSSTVHPNIDAPMIGVFSIQQEISMIDTCDAAAPTPPPPPITTTSSRPTSPIFPRLQFRPELDGLRTFAVIPVVLYHFNVSFPGGFAGVDVFFVISGYLITSVLLSSLESQSFQIKNFFLRRCRRLFPASVKKKPILPDIIYLLFEGFPGFNTCNAMFLNIVYFW